MAILNMQKTTEKVEIKKVAQVAFNRNTKLASVTYNGKNKSRCNLEKYFVGEL